MKRVIKLSEEKLYEIITNVISETNLGDYDDSDFLEAFMVTFRKWITEKLGDDAKRYPLSLLLKKYGTEFEKSLGIFDPQYEDDDDYDRWRLIRSAQTLIKSGKYVLPNLNTGEKFTEKYQKALPLFIKQIDLPDFISVEFQEPEPNNVNVTFNVDFPKMLVAEKARHLNAHNFLQKLKEYLSNFVGVEFGNPAHGNVKITSDLKYIGADEWIKNVLNKKIKKEIKQLPNAQNAIHSMKFEIYSGKVTLKINFKDSCGYNSRSILTQNIRDYIDNQGYNPEIFRIER